MSLFGCKTSKTVYVPVESVKTDYWTEFDVNLSSIFTSLIVAKDANIQFLSGNRISVLDSSGNVVAGITGVGTGYPIFAGGSDPATAPFRVAADGSFVATNATIQSNSSGNKIVIDPTTRSFKCVTSSGIVTASIAFDSGFGKLLLQNESGESFYATPNIAEFANGTETLLLQAKQLVYTANSGSTVFAVQRNATNGLLELFAKNLPTSSSGLTTGQIWRDGTTLKIVS